MLVQRKPRAILPVYQQQQTCSFFWSASYLCRVTRLTSSWLSYLCKDPISKYCLILRDWGVRVSTVNFGGKTVQLVTMGKIIVPNSWFIVRNHSEWFLIQNGQQTSWQVMSTQMFLFLSSFNVFFLNYYLILITFIDRFINKSYYFLSFTHSVVINSC